MAVLAMGKGIRPELECTFTMNATGDPLGLLTLIVLIRCCQAEKLQQPPELFCIERLTRFTSRLMNITPHCSLAHEAFHYALRQHLLQQLPARALGRLSLYMSSLSRRDPISRQRCLACYCLKIFAAYTHNPDPDPNSLCKVNAIKYALTFEVMPPDQTGEAGLSTLPTGAVLFLNSIATCS